MGIFNLGIYFLTLLGPLCFISGSALWFVSLQKDRTPDDKSINNTDHNVAIIFISGSVLFFVVTLIHLIKEYRQPRNIA